jgi:hypothetical protein
VEVWIGKHPPCSLHAIGLNRSSITTATFLKTQIRRKHHDLHP